MHSTHANPSLPIPVASPVAELSAVAKRYGRVIALDGVDLSLEAGAVTALLGPNGAGKTTAVHLLLGLLRPDAGRVRLFGGDPRATRARTRVGVMMQISGVPDTLRVREHLELFASYYPQPLPLARAVAAAGLAGLEKRSFAELSGGEKQRLMFALALIGDPDLLFLDEPTTGLDVTARRAFWGHVRDFVRGGRTVLLTTHYLEEADALADRVVVLDRGKVVADDSPEGIKTRAAARRVRCVTHLDPERIAGWPGVQEARREGRRLEVLTTDGEATARRLLAADPALADLEVAPAGLEDAFLHLTDGDRPEGDEERRKGAA